MVAWYILRELSICSVIFWTFYWAHNDTWVLGSTSSVVISLKSINICFCPLKIFTLLKSQLIASSLEFEGRCALLSFSTSDSW